MLSGFDAVERAELEDVLMRAEESVLDVVARGVTPAMNKLNTKTPPRSGGEAAGAASPRGKK